MNIPDLNRSFGFLVHDVARLLGKRFAQQAKGLGLTRAQGKALAYLARHEGIHQAGLAELLEIEPITLVRLLDRMEEAGWIERRPDPADRRARRLFLAAKAEPIFAEMRRIAEATRSEAFAGLSPEQQESLLDMLTRVRVNLLDRDPNGAAVERPASAAVGGEEEAPGDAPRKARGSAR
ncbi:MAG TPA: MarR family transcriptional regulator [Alphaproteobacteria bacterium]|nr:MarR family transcriptional regulator [Alphaproteobacteria bacterium]